MVSTLHHFIPILSTCRLFQDLPLEDLPPLLKSMKVNIEEYLPGSIVKHQGDRYESLIIVAEGSLETRIDDGSGRGMIVEYFRTMSLVASAVLVSSNPVLPVSLIAREKTTLICIGIEDLFRIFSREPVVMKAYMADAGDKVRFLTEKLRLFRFGTLRQRIAGHLLSLASEQGTEHPGWRHGREKMADLLGVARPSLSRELSLMTQDGIIKGMDRRHVRFSSSELRALLDDG